MTVSEQVGAECSAACDEVMATDCSTSCGNPTETCEEVCWSSASCAELCAGDVPPNFALLCASCGAGNCGSLCEGNCTAACTVFSGLCGDTCGQISTGCQTQCPCDGGV